MYDRTKWLPKEYCNICRMVTKHDTIKTNGTYFDKCTECKIIKYKSR